MSGLAVAPLHSVRHGKDRSDMKHVNIYPAPSGGWIYEVWVAARAVVIGCCGTREAAEHEASIV